MSEETHKALHGLPTMYTGSNVNGIPSCNEDICAQRCTLASQREFHDDDFAKAKDKRRSRPLVAPSPDDARSTQKTAHASSSYFCK